MGLTGSSDDDASDAQHVPRAALGPRGRGRGLRGAGARSAARTSGPPQMGTHDTYTRHAPSALGVQVFGPPTRPNPHPLDRGLRGPVGWYFLHALGRGFGRRASTSRANAVFLLLAIHRPRVASVLTGLATGGGGRRCASPDGFWTRPPPPPLQHPSPLH